MRERNSGETELFHEAAELLAQVEEELVELQAFENETEAKQQALLYIESISKTEIIALNEAITETSEIIDMFDDLEQIYFLDVAVRPMVQILHQYRSDHNKSWPKNMYLPIGREIQLQNKHNLEKIYQRAKEHVVAPESGTVLVIDEFSYSGQTLSEAVRLMQNTFPNLTVEQHAMLDRDTASGLFTVARPGTDSDGVQWDNPNIRFRFPVKRDDQSSVRVTYKNMEHTTQEVYQLAKQVRQDPYSHSQTYIEKKKEMARLDTVFYRTYVQELKKVVLSQ